MYKFIQHYKLEEWGQSLLIMEKSGKGFGRVYWYNDDYTKVYLDMLSVTAYYRCKGLGTALQQLRESYAKRVLKASHAILWVNKNTWMFEWYIRRGYIPFKNHETEIDCVWMKKTLI